MSRHGTLLVMEDGYEFSNLCVPMMQGFMCSTLLKDEMHHSMQQGEVTTTTRQISIRRISIWPKTLITST